MFQFYEDYFSIEPEDSFSQELYYWEDVLRVAYYVQSDAYDYRLDKERIYLIVEHRCGQYLKIPYLKGEEGEFFDRNLDKYLSIKIKNRRKLLDDPPANTLLDFYVREK